MKEAAWVVIEPDPTGHHVAYLEQLLELARERHVRITLVFPPPDSSFDEARISNLGQTGAHVVRVPLGQGQIFRIARRSLAASAVERVVILDVDRWVLAVALAQALARKANKLRVLVMRPVVQEPTLRSRLRFAAKQWLGRLLLRSAGPGSVAILVPAGSQWQVNWPTSVEVVRDVSLVRPVQVDKVNARRHLGVPERALVISQLGVLSARKNPEVLAAAAGLVAEESELPVCLLSVGTDQDGSTRVLQLADDKVSVVSRAEFVDDSTLSVALRASDVVACLYSNEGSSGIVMAAMAHDVPVVAAGSVGVTGMVRDLNAGVVCDLDPRAVADAILVLQGWDRQQAASEPPSATITNWLWPGTATTFPREK